MLTVYVALVDKKIHFVLFSDKVIDKVAQAAFELVSFLPQV